MRLIGRTLFVAFGVLLAAKFTIEHGLPWWLVLAPIWLPFLASITLPLLPAYRRYALRKGLVLGSPTQRHVRERHPFAPTVARCAVCNPSPAGVLGLLRFKINKAISRLDGAR